MLQQIPALTPRSRGGKGTIRHRCVAFAGLMVAANVAMAQTNWVNGTPGNIPFDAIVAAYQPVFRHGGGVGIPEPLYVCRGGAKEGYGTQVGNFQANFTGCNIGYGGTEIFVPDFEFLVTSWQSASFGSVPSNAVNGGSDAGGPLYYCRANIAGSDLEPGKIRPGFPGCSIPYGGVEHWVSNYQVLVSLSLPMPLNQKLAIGGSIPSDAIRGGIDDDGSDLYLCSAFYGSGFHPGKLRPSFKGCDVSYGGGEHVVSSYYVLVANWTPFQPTSPPAFDFPAGTDVGGQPLHACRAYSGGNIYPGKMRADWSACDFAWGGTEQWSTTFDVLSY